MRLELLSPCKVNLVLNILGRRPDGFHEIETVMLPVNVCDRLTFAPAPAEEVQLACDNPALPVDGSNLVCRAARAFLDAAPAVRGGVSIHLEKRIPMAAGLGGGSGNAATTLLGMSELFGHPLPPAQLAKLAATLGSDVAFFLQKEPALATGRGECVEPLGSFPALAGLAILLIHPGFGISTPWAYQALSQFPEALNGQPGRARQLIEAMRNREPGLALRHLYNSLEAPALLKYPVLGLYQEFLRAEGALGTLMSGSGSTTFAIVRDVPEGDRIASAFRARFGDAAWVTTVSL